MKNYHFTSCGLDYIYLKNGFKKHKTPYGQGVSIENIDGLYSAITHFICNYRSNLKGQDVRFLRKGLGVTQAVLASILGVDKQTIARWEKDETEMPVPAQRLLRLFCLEKLDGKSEINALIEHLNAIEDNMEKVVFHEKDDNWKAAA